MQISEEFHAVYLIVVTASLLTYFVDGTYTPFFLSLAKTSISSTLKLLFPFPRIYELPVGLENPEPIEEEAVLPETASKNLLFKNHTKRYAPKSDLSPNAMQ